MGQWLGSENWGSTVIDNVLARAAAAVQARIVRDERGATAVEYGLIVGLIAVAIIGAIVAMSGALSGLFGEITTELENAGN